LSDKSWLYRQSPAKAYAHAAVIVSRAHIEYLPFVQREEALAKVEAETKSIFQRLDREYQDRKMIAQVTAHTHKAAGMLEGVHRYKEKLKYARNLTRVKVAAQFITNKSKYRKMIDKKDMTREGRKNAEIQYAKGIISGLDPQQKRVGLEEIDKLALDYMR